jgi:membrane protease YdiL (CAAX protease family)
VHPPIQVIPKQPSLRATITAVIATVVITIFVFGLLLLLALSVPAVRAEFPAAATLSIWVHALLVLTAAVLIVRRDGVPLKGLGFVRPRRRLLHLLWQIPITMIVLLVVQGVAFAVVAGTSPSSRTTGLDSLLADADPATTVLGFFGIAILTPLWEETVFRGMIFGTVYARWGTVAAVLVSAAIFAVVHGIPILLPYMITLGLALGLLRTFHRNLWGPLALHMTINSIATASLLAVVLG